MLSGQLIAPAGFTLKSEYEEMTVLKALALADNAKSTAKQDKAMILRKNLQKPGGREEIPVQAEPDHGKPCSRSAPIC